MNRRGFLGGIGALAVVGGLSACGGNDTAGGGGGEAGSTDAAELNYYVWNEEQAKIMTKAMPTFNEKYPGIKVNITTTPYKEYFTKLQTQVSSGTDPDVYAMRGASIDLYASEGLLSPIDDLISEGRIDPANYPPALVDLYKVDGKQYGVPYDYDSVALWYNKAIFDQAGEEYPTDDWTWDDFTGTAARISEKLKGEGIYGCAAEPGDSQISYYNTIPAAGGYVISEDGTTSGYDQPEAIEGLDFWAQLMQNGSAPTIQQLTDQAGSEWFAAAKAAMIYAAAYNAPTFLESDHADDFQIVRLPTKVTNSSVVHGVANVVSARSKNQAAAKALVEWLSGEDYAKLIAASGIIIPAFAGTAEAYLAVKPEWNLQTFIDAAADENGSPYPSSLNTQAWASIEPNVFGDLWSGGKTAEQAGQEMAAQMNALLAEEK